MGDFWRTPTADELREANAVAAGIHDQCQQFGCSNQVETWCPLCRAFFCKRHDELWPVRRHDCIRGPKDPDG